MFRPTTPGRDPRYALGDPGHEYIPGVTESWLGPLAREWQLHGERATLAGRANLYRHRTPDGSTDLLPHVNPQYYRPVHSGVFHASKSFNAWLVTQTPEVRARAKAVFARCAAEIYEREIAQDLSARIKKGGRESVPVKTVGVAFVHETNAAGLYHLHVHLEVHNVGRTADGMTRAVDNSPLFYRQGLYSMAFMAQLSHTLWRELGLDARPSPTGLKVMGYEALRGVKTPRQEQIDDRLKEKKIPNTPKARDFASRSTHDRRDPKLTIGEALSRSVAWLRTKGLDKLRARAEKVRGSSILREEKRTERAIRAAVRLVSAVGRHVTYREFCVIARCEAARRRVNLQRVENELVSLRERPGRYKLEVVAPDLFTTKRIEKSRARWGRTLAAQATAKAKSPRTIAVSTAVLRSGDPSVEEVARVTSVLRHRVLVTPDVTPRLKVVYDAYEADRKRRTFVVSGLQTAGNLGRELGSVVQDAETFAAGLSKTPLWETFLQVRRHRWRSLDHVGQLVKQIRRPTERLTRRDLVVLDTRGASHHALATIAETARKAGATVVVISSLDIIVHHKTRTRGPARDL